MLKSNVNLSVSMQMDDNKSLSFTVGRIPKGLRFSKVMVPAQKVTGFEPLGMVLRPAWFPSLGPRQK